MLLLAKIRRKLTVGKAFGVFNLFGFVWGLERKGKISCEVVFKRLILNAF